MEHPPRNSYTQRRVGVQRALLQSYFDEEVVRAFYIVAFNPRVRKVTSDQDLVKRYHMRQILQNFQITDPKEVVFFDDIAKNCQDCRDYCGVHAIKINESVGFQFGDVLKLMS
jgi:predicted phosphatase